MYQGLVHSLSEFSRVWSRVECAVKLFIISIYFSYSYLIESTSDTYFWTKVISLFRISIQLPWFLVSTKRPKLVFLRSFGPLKMSPFFFPFTRQLTTFLSKLIWIDTFLAYKLEPALNGYMTETPSSELFTATPTLTLPDFSLS